MWTSPEEGKGPSPGLPQCYPDSSSRERLPDLPVPTQGSHTAHGYAFPPPLEMLHLCLSGSYCPRLELSERHQEHGLVVVWLLLLECQQVAGSGASPKTVFVLSQLLPGNPSHMSPFRGQDGLTSLTCSCGQAGQSLCFLPLRSMSMRDAVAQILLPLTYTPYRMRTAVSEGNEGRDELLNQK